MTDETDDASATHGPKKRSAAAAKSALRRKRRRRAVSIPSRASAGSTSTQSARRSGYRERYWIKTPESRARTVRRPAFAASSTMAHLAWKSVRR